jgi:hypothetical protein
LRLAAPFNSSTDTGVQPGTQLEFAENRGLKRTWNDRILGSARTLEVERCLANSKGYAVTYVQPPNLSISETVDEVIVCAPHPV